MRRLGRLAWHLPEVICIVVLAGITAIIGGAVTSRYLFFFAFTWAEELVRFLFIWLAFLGGALGVKYGVHFRLTLLRDALSIRGGWLLDLLGHVCFAALGGVLLVYGIEIVVRSLEQVSPALEIPQGLVYLAIPLGGGLMAMYSMVHAVQAWRTRKRTGATVAD